MNKVRSWLKLSTNDDSVNQTAQYHEKYDSQFGETITKTVPILLPKNTNLNESENKNAVQVLKNVPYYMESIMVGKAIIDKQCCNIYIPPRIKNSDHKFPVIIFVHGGSWRRGDRSHRYFDVYGNNAKYFAQAGFIVVVPSYRLSPAVKHPCHCEDVSLALKFVHQNIESYGGDRNLVFLMVSFYRLLDKNDSHRDIVLADT